MDRASVSEAEGHWFESSSARHSTCWQKTHVPEDRFGIQGPVVLAIVSTDPLIDESIGFRAIAKAGRLLDGSGLGAIVMLTVAELERWLLLRDADSLARESLIAWERLDPHIAAGWKELFPFYGQKRNLIPHSAWALI